LFVTLSLLCSLPIFPSFSDYPHPRRATLPRACLPGWLVSEVCIEVADCWKVFGGRDVDKAIAMAEAGAGRAEILERTGATVAVRSEEHTYELQSREK